MSNKVIGGGSETINMLRFPLAAFVVILHSFGEKIDVSSLHASGISGMAIYEYVGILLSNVVTQCAVPIFFFISGYLLFLNVGEYSMTVYCSKLRKRCHSLAIPYLIWITLYILKSLVGKMPGFLVTGSPLAGIIGFFQEYGALHMYWDSHVWDSHITWLGIENHISGPYLHTFWYMRDLMLMVLFSPLIYWLFKRLRLLLVAFLLCLYASEIWVPWWSDSLVRASLFFSFGAYFGITKQSFTDALWKWRHAIFPIAIFLIAFETYQGAASGNALSRCAYPWLIVFESLAFILAASQICKYRGVYERMSQLSCTSFFIYAFHPFILLSLKRLFERVMPMHDAWFVKLSCYLLIPLVCIALCIFLYRALQRFLPRMLRVMVWERK